MKTKVNKTFLLAATSILFILYVTPNSYAQTETEDRLASLFEQSDQESDKQEYVDICRETPLPFPEGIESESYLMDDCTDFLDDYGMVILNILTALIAIALLYMLILNIIRYNKRLQNPENDSKPRTIKEENERQSVLSVPEQGTIWNGKEYMKYRLHEYFYQNIPMPEYYRIEYIADNDAYHIVSAPIRKDRSFEVYYWNKFFEGKKTSKELLASLGYGENIGIVFDTDGIQIYDKERFANYYYAFTFIYDVAVIYNKEKRASGILLDFIERMRQRINVEDVNEFTEKVARHSAISNENLMELIKDDDGLQEFADYTNEKDPE